MRLAVALPRVAQARSPCIASSGEVRLELGGYTICPSGPSCLTSPAGLEKLKALNTLVLSHNDVDSMGTWLAGATALVKLSLSHNSIGEIGAALK